MELHGGYFSGLQLCTVGTVQDLRGRGAGDWPQDPGTCEPHRPRQVRDWPLTDRGQGGEGSYVWLTCVCVCIREHARQVKGSLLYGELLPRGVNKVRREGLDSSPYHAPHSCLAGSWAGPSGRGLPLGTVRPRHGHGKGAHPGLPSV